MTENEKELSSSQDNLPLSQETFNNLLNMLKVPVTDVLQVRENMQDIGSTNQLPVESRSLVEYLGTFFNSEDVSPSVSMPAKSMLVPTSDWPGDFDFKVKFHSQQPSTNITWTYSEKLNKLFVKKDSPCPISFTTNALLPNHCTFIRAMAVYSSPKNAMNVVTRCINHSMAELEKNVFQAEHFIQSQSLQATYVIDPETKRHSIIIPYENPAAGQGYSTYLYKFVCYSSCGGGPNRRPMTVVFTLEQGNAVIGRCAFDLKVCACPSRDKKIDEGPKLTIPSLEENEPKEEEVAEPVAKKAKLVNGSDPSMYLCAINVTPKKLKEKKEFVTKVIDERHYKFLKEMDKYYRCRRSLNVLPPNTISSLFLLLRSSSSESE